MFFMQENRGFHTKTNYDRDFWKGFFQLQIKSIINFKGYIKI